jgi:hypothetical protein
MATVETQQPTPPPPVRRRRFLTSWPLWIAVVSFPIAIWAGWVHQVPHGEVLLEPKGDNCPDYRSLTSTSTTTVGASSSTLAVSTELHLTLSGVTPASPPQDENLGQPDIPNDFTGCFIATSARIKSVTWADGRIDAVLELADDDPTVSTKLARDHSSITVDPCNPSTIDSDSYWSPAICGANTNNTVVVRTSPPIDTLLTTPFPTKTQTGDDYVETSWQFTGSTPPLTVDIDVPFTVMATSWLHGDGATNYLLKFTDSAIGVDLRYLAEAIAFWTAVVAAIWILRRRENSVGWRQRFDYRILLIALAGILLAVKIPKAGHLGPDIALGFVNVLVWGILSAALAPKKWLPAVGVLVAAPLATLSFLAIALPPHPIKDALFLVYFVLLLMLVGVGAWALWKQITTIFVLTELDAGPTQWQLLYGRVLSCVMVGAFVVAVGFPIGTVLNRGGYTYDQYQYLAADLTWSTGILFREALAWTTILLLVSFLAAYIGRPAAATTSVAAVLALMVSLSAPWTNGVSIVVVAAIPVWFLQFGVLWLAFKRITARSDNRYLAHAADGVDDADLLKAATASSADAATSAHAPQEIPAQDATPAPVRAARQRLLIAGPRSQRLENAKVCGQIAGILAIVPVAYMIWTTLSSLGSQFSTNTGLLIVAVFAVLELVRWVVSGFAFGYLYPDLPGRIGAVKALAFSAIYIASCAAPLMIARGFGHDLVHETVYRSSQFALFSIVLAVVYDLWTVRSKGGDWQELQKIYDLEDYGRIAATVAPAAILILTVAHEIIAGSGFDVADSLLSAVTDVLRSGPL